jgi:hypothetical protein
MQRLLAGITPTVAAECKVHQHRKDTATGAARADVAQQLMACASIGVLAPAMLHKQAGSTAARMYHSAAVDDMRTHMRAGSSRCRCKRTAQQLACIMVQCILCHQHDSSKQDTTLSMLLLLLLLYLALQAGLIPRIFQYLWRRMPEVQASMLAHTAKSMAAAGSGPSSPSSKECEAAGDEASSSSSSSSGRAVQPSLTWLVRCSMLEIHRCGCVRA